MSTKRLTQLSARHFKLALNVVHRIETREGSEFKLDPGSREAASLSRPWLFATTHTYHQHFLLIGASSQKVRKLKLHRSRKSTICGKGLDDTELQCWSNVVTIRNNVATMLQRCVALKIVVANSLV